jgi:hypothetical protein
MSVKDISKKIELLEKLIKENQGDLNRMNDELQRLKLQAFEEDYREEDNRRLLQG